MGTAPAAPLLTTDDVRVAGTRIAERVRRTPVLELPGSAVGLSERRQLVLKLDLLQPTGSFKVRGAFNLLLSREVGPAGVVAASGGNYGLAIAYAARELGIRATVFVPDSSPAEKIERLAGLGAQIHVVAGFYADAGVASEEHRVETGATLAHPFDQPEVVAGQGTCAMELEDDAGLPDTVLVAVGGGGLIAGIATWFGDRARIVAVETEGTPTLSAARDAGARVEVEIGGIAASSLGAPVIGEHGWAASQRWVDASLLVTDDEVREAQYRLWEATRLVAEPGGAVALAALTSGRYRPGPDERVAVILCGANTDPASVVRPGP